GKLDAVVANSAENDFAIVLGNGDGTFQDIEEFVSGVNVRSVAIGDYTGDGKVDYLVNSGAGSTSSVVLFNGNGKGIFQKSTVTTIGSDVYSIAAADFNNDKKLDFVAAQQNANRISVVLGNGNGTFNGTIGTYTTDAGPVSVAVGDVNHDGYPDIVT